MAITLATYNAAKSALTQLRPGTPEYMANQAIINNYTAEQARAAAIAKLAAETGARPANIIVPPGMENALKAVNATNPSTGGFTTTGSSGVASSYPTDANAIAAMRATYPVSSGAASTKPTDPNALRSLQATFSDPGLTKPFNVRTEPQFSTPKPAPFNTGASGAPDANALRNIAATGGQYPGAGTTAAGGTSGAATGAGGRISTDAGTGASTGTSLPGGSASSATRPVIDAVNTAQFSTARPGLRSAAELAAQFGNINYDMNSIKGIFDKATNAEYDVLGKAYDQTQNQYYNRLYDNQSLAMDTQRKMNASAVANGASKGMQAATALSGILGLQQTSAADSTALAQGRNALSDKRLAAMEKNTALAMTQAEQAKMDLLKNSQNLYAADTQFSVADLSAQAQADLAAKQLQAAGITANANMYGTDRNYDATVYSSNNALAGTKYGADASVRGAGISAAGAVNAAKSMPQYSTQTQTPATTLQSLLKDAFAAGDKEAAIGYLLQTGITYNEATKLVAERMAPPKVTSVPAQSTGGTQLPAWLQQFFEPGAFSTDRGN